MVVGVEPAYVTEATMRWYAPPPPLVFLQDNSRHLIFFSIPVADLLSRRISIIHISRPERYNSIVAIDGQFAKRSWDWPAVVPVCGALTVIVGKLLYGICCN